MHENFLKFRRFALSDVSLFLAGRRTLFIVLLASPFSWTNRKPYPPALSSPRLTNSRQYFIFTSMCNMVKKTFFRVYLIFPKKRAIMLYRGV
jgi:hypothetical protein